jgi:hypothetical protein
LVADRAYANYAGIAHVVAKRAQVTVRFNPHAIRVLDGTGKVFPLKARLRNLQKTHQVASWAVELTGASGKAPIAGRLCVVRKSQAAIARARAKVKRSASRNGTQVQEETLFFAEYVMVFTTVPASLLAPGGCSRTLPAALAD